MAAKDLSETEELQILTAFHNADVDILVRTIKDEAEKLRQVRLYAWHNLTNPADTSKITRSSIQLEIDHFIIQDVPDELDDILDDIQPIPSDFDEMLRVAEQAGKILENGSQISTVLLEAKHAAQEREDDALIADEQVLPAYSKFETM